MNGFARSAGGCGDWYQRALFADPRLVAGHADHLAGGLEFAAVVLRAGEAAVGDDIVAQADVAGVAVLAAVAGEAAVAVVREDDRNDRLAGFLHLVGLGVDDHAVLHDARCSESWSAGRALDVDEAGAAARVGFQPVDVAEAGDVEAVVLEDFDERGAGGRIDGPGRQP